MRAPDIVWQEEPCSVAYWVDGGWQHRPGLAYTSEYMGDRLRVVPDGCYGWLAYLNGKDAGGTWPTREEAVAGLLAWRLTVMTYPAPRRREWGVRAWVEVYGPRGGRLRPPKASAPKPKPRGAKKARKQE